MNLHDEDLLTALVHAGKKLLEAALEQDLKAWRRPMRDRWPYPLPLRYELQVRYLYAFSLDAFDLLLRGLEESASPAAVGAIRTLAEHHVTISWLLEPSSALERQVRAYRIVLSNIRRTRRAVQHAQSEEAPQAEEIKQSLAVAEGTLKTIAAADGVARVREAPDRVTLFDRYSPPGYLFFCVLSELGAHPSFLPVFAFHGQQGSRVTRFDRWGAHMERAHKIALAYPLLALTCLQTGKAFGWTRWLDRTNELLLETGPLLEEAMDRWDQKRGLW